MKKKITLFILVIATAAIFVFWPSRQSKIPDIYKIGVVNFTSVDKMTFGGFKEGMELLGYGGAGKPVEYLFESVNGDRALFPSSIAKVIAFQPDLIFVCSTPATQAVQEATRENRIPVVFGPVNDPLAAGIVEDIRHPSGHITGIRLSPSDVRRLQLFHQLAPNSHNLFLPYYPDDNSSVASVNQIMAESQKLGINIIPSKILTDEDLAHAFLQLPEKVDGIFLPRDSRIEKEIDEWVALSLRHKIPLCAPSRQQVERGALFSYGFSHRRIGQQAARLATQILEGADPGTLPVEAAENLSFLNMKTAKAIDLELPNRILRQMHEIIR